MSGPLAPPIDPRALRTITTITAVAAVVAGALLVTAHFVPALGAPGLLALFAVPVVRNVVVVVLTRGADRWLGLLGALIVAVVIVVALR